MLLLECTQERSLILMGKAADASCKTHFIHERHHLQSQDESATQPYTKTTHFEGLGSKYF